MIRKISFAIAALGILILLSLAFVAMEGELDKTHLLKGRIGIGIIVLLLMTAVAIFYLIRSLGPSFIGARLRDKVSGLPVFSWIALGFLINFFLFYITPTFLNSRLQIQYPQNYIMTARSPVIGNDLQAILKAATSIFKPGEIPTSKPPLSYINTPVENLLFSPLAIMDYPTAYKLFTFFTFMSYILSILLAILISEKEHYASILLVGVMSIFSYGLVFEFERGQLYSNAFMLALAAVYIFHKHPAFRFLAYVLFCVSVQLEYSPALFVLLFVEDWRDWRNNLKRFAALGLANFLLLFLQGFAYFKVFFLQYFAANADPETWKGNHSISSFVVNYGMRNNVLLMDGLYAFVLICILAVLVHSYLENRKGFNADLFLVLTIGALVLPSISHDYTLPILAAPFALTFSRQINQDHFWKGIILILLVLIASLAYSATLFSYTFRPDILRNTLPELLIILATVTLMNFLKGRKAEMQPPSLEAV